MSPSWNVDGHGGSNDQEDYDRPDITCSGPPGSDFTYVCKYSCYYDFLLEDYSISGLEFAYEVVFKNGIVPPDELLEVELLKLEQEMLTWVGDELGLTDVPCDISKQVDINRNRRTNGGGGRTLNILSPLIANLASLNVDRIDRSVDQCTGGITEGCLPIIGEMTVDYDCEGEGCSEEVTSTVLQYLERGMIEDRFVDYKGSLIAGVVFVGTRVQPLVELGGGTDATPRAEQNWRVQYAGMSMILVALLAGISGLAFLVKRRRDRYREEEEEEKAAAAALEEAKSDEQKHTDKDGEDSFSPEPVWPSYNMSAMVQEVREPPNDLSTIVEEETDVSFA